MITLSPHRSVHLSLVVGLLVAASAVSATTPESGPASAPAKASYATPKEAMRSYIQARFAKNAAATREAIDVPAARKADVEAAVDAIVASDALQKAAVDRFGADGRKVFDPDNAAKLVAALQTLEKSPAEVNGDKATIAGPADADGRITSATALTKTPSGWKIDGALLIDAGGDAADATQRVALFRKSEEVSKTVATSIAAGKYPAANDAYREYVKLMGQAVREVTEPAAATVPATAAATVSATTAATLPAAKP